MNSLGATLTYYGFKQRCLRCRECVELKSTQFEALPATERATLHNGYHTELPARAQVGVRYAAHLMWLVAPDFCAGKRLGNPETCHRYFEGMTRWGYDSPDREWRACCRTLVDLAAELARLDVFFDSQIYATSPGIGWAGLEEIVWSERPRPEGVGAEEE